MKNERRRLETSFFPFMGDILIFIFYIAVLSILFKVNMLTGQICMIKVVISSAGSNSQQFNNFNE